MRRLPRGRVAAIRPFRYRWLIVLGAFFALVGAGITVGLDQKQAAVSPNEYGKRLDCAAGRLLGPEPVALPGRPDPGGHAARRFADADAS
jgi:hypothetical protein